MKKRRTFLQRCVLHCIDRRHLPSFNNSEKYTATWLWETIEEGKVPIVIGEPFTGKTFSAFLNVEESLRMESFLDSNRKQAIYVDCKNGIEEIVEFLYYELRTSANGADKHIIIDNAEQLGESFVSSIIRDIQEYPGQLIMIFDAKKIPESLHFSQIHYCDKPAPSPSFDVDKYNKLSSGARLMLWTLYYYTSISTLIDKQEFANVWDSIDTEEKAHRLLKELNKCGFAKPFYLEKGYYYLPCFRSMEESSHSIKEAQDAAKLILTHHVFEKEHALKWIALVTSKPSFINEIDQKERHRLFDNSFSFGSPDFMYNYLLNETRYDLKKNSLFLYERGTLEFSKGNHEKAFSVFDTLLEKTTNDDLRYLLMLKIIEAVHGQNEKVITERISRYINEIKQKSKKYTDYAKYWELHIDSERGIFRTKDLEVLLNRIQKSSGVPEGLKNHTIKRCYTDAIRLYCLQMTRPPKQLTKDFISFLSTHYSKTTQYYYEQLYVKANVGHYVDFLENIFRLVETKKLFEQCTGFYHNALNSGNEDYKSLKACKLKAIDFSMNKSEMSREEYCKATETIDLFIQTSRINKVDVHVAYGLTLSFKVSAVFNLNCFEGTGVAMDQHLLDEARRIYHAYGNTYGLMRIAFLSYLVELTKTHDGTGISDIITKLDELLKKYPEYLLENNILNDIKAKFEEGELLPAYRHALLRAYPIILQ